MQNKLIIIALLAIAAVAAFFAFRSKAAVLTTPVELCKRVGSCKGGTCKSRRVQTTRKANPVRTCVNGVCSVPVKTTKAVAKGVKKAVKAVTPSCRSCRK